MKQSVSFFHSLFLFCETCSSRSNVVRTALNFLKDHSAFILKVKMKAMWSLKMLGTICTVSHPRRPEFSSLLLILLKLPVIMMWAPSYGIANVSISVFIASMQKHSSKLVQWQCITYKKDSKHVKIFIYFLANRQISTYTIHQKKKKHLNPSMTNYQNEKQILWQWYRRNWITGIEILLLLALPNKSKPDKKEK